MRAFLHRLRLRLGLFRWKNYADIFPEDFSEPVSSLFTYLTGTTVTVQRYRWRVCNWPASPVTAGVFESYRDAIRHIRRCVRQGVRP
jgi:hypothetical protein